MKFINKQLAKRAAPVRLFVFTGVLSIVWLPLAIPIYLALKNNPNLATILTMALLFLELLCLWQLWGKYVYREPKIFARYGLIVSAANLQEFVGGLTIGFGFCWSLFIFEAVCGWIDIASSELNLVKVAIEGLFSAFAIAVTEELLFRGWLLDELRRDYKFNTAIGANALIFAVMHFIKPWAEIIRTIVTFPALVLLGIALAIAKQRCHNRLGMPIGLHAGLVWGYYIVNVGELITYSDRVPVWITGIDNNPIAGIVGLTFLSVLTRVISRFRIKAD